VKDRLNAIEYESFFKSVRLRNFERLFQNSHTRAEGSEAEI
jgi:hypothetical protein